MEAFTAPELAWAAAPVGNAKSIGDTAADDLVITVLRAYFHRWKWEVGQFFDGVGPDSSDDELLGAAQKHPILRITATS